MVGRVKNEFSDAPAEMLGIVVNAVRSGIVLRLFKAQRCDVRSGAAKPGSAGVKTNADRQDPRPPLRVRGRHQRGGERSESPAR